MTYISRREMVGRRLPVIDLPDGTQKMTMPERPGDYCGPVVGYTGDKPAVFFYKPNARDTGAPAISRSLQHVVSPPHTYRECPDGSLEIRNSLGDTRSGSDESDGWHGWLNEGHRWEMQPTTASDPQGEQ